MSKILDTESYSFYKFVLTPENPSKQGKRSLNTIQNFQLWDTPIAL